MNIPDYKVTDEELIRSFNCAGFDGSCIGCFNYDDCHNLANFAQEKALKATYPCGGCKGEKYITRCDFEEIPCQTCNGTGRGSPMFAQLDPDQKVPDNTYSPGGDQNDVEPKLYHTYDEAQLDMYNQGWRKTIPR